MKTNWLFWILLAAELYMITCIIHNHIVCMMFFSAYQKDKTDYEQVSSTVTHMNWTLNIWAVVTFMLILCICYINNI